jgi:hypothetical protein
LFISSGQLPDEPGIAISLPTRARAATSARNALFEVN